MIHDFTFALVQYPTYINVILGALGSIMVISGLLTLYQYSRTNTHSSISKYRLATFFLSAICFASLFTISMHFTKEALQTKRFDLYQTATAVVVNSNSSWLKNVEFEVINDTENVTYITHNNKVYSLNK